MNYLSFHAILILLLFKCLLVNTIPTTTQATKLFPETSANNNINEKNVTIDELVQEQTDTIKKIVSAEQSRIDYPIVTKSEPVYKEEIKKEVEHLTLEELKIKCQHLEKLFSTNNTQLRQTIQNNKNDRVDNVNFSTKISNHKPYYFQRRPVYVQPKPLVTTKPPSTQNNNGFYITTAPTTKKSSITANTIPPNVKYIRLEPVILQKTILNDGKTIYYWHRSLPTAVQYPLNQNLADSSSENGIQNQSETTTENHETETVQTSTSSYYAYDFRNFFPSFYSSSRSVSTTEKPSTTTTTTTETTISEESDDLLYTHQLRFVVPVPYDNSEKAGYKYPWDFDQFAYYPKQLHPKTVNVQVPYSPTFHYIKSIAIPNKSSEGEKIENIEVP